MITPEEEAFILDQAYVPEHSVPLMTSVSDGEPLLLGDYFCCRKGDWIVAVAYPLGRDFKDGDPEDLLEMIRRRYSPRLVSLMAPILSPSLSGTCDERESDHFYTVDPEEDAPKEAARRLARRAKRELSVSCTGEMNKDHQELSKAFIRRARPGLRVRDLLFKMPAYVAGSKHAAVLSARDRAGHLSAFYVLDLAAKAFSSYVIGCYSTKHYVPGASDLLCAEMIRLSREREKKYIHLGLGINEGIRRFKTKWGGRAARRYERCELVLRKPSILDMFLSSR